MSGRLANPSQAVIRMQRILCGVDFSDFSRHALAHAAAIARWYKATVTLFHAHAPAMSADLGAGPGASEPFVQAGQRDRLLQELTRFAESAGAADVPIVCEVWPGPAIRGILERAASLPADLIVLGTYGRSGVDRLMLGSVAEKVLRKAAAPTLTVPPPAAAPGVPATTPFARILCPVDFSESSMKAVAYALSLAREAGAYLILMHVVEGVSNTEHWKQPDPMLLRYLKNAEEQALGRLREAVSAGASQASRPEMILTTGKAYRQILDVAAARDIRLIVMGVHGRGPLNLVLFGSTTEHVVRMASCPVLTLRA